MTATGKITLRADSAETTRLVTTSNAADLKELGLTQPEAAPAAAQEAPKEAPKTAGNDLLSAKDSAALIEAFTKLRDKDATNDLAAARQINEALKAAGASTGKFGTAVDNATDGQFFGSASAGDTLREVASTVHKQLAGGKATGLSAKEIAEALERANVQIGDKGTKDKHAGVTAQSITDMKYYQAQLVKSQQPQ